MYRATTPTHTFTLPIATNTCKEIQVTYKQGKVSLVKHYQDETLPEGMTLDGNDVIIVLTQDETLKFNSKEKVAVQVRVLTNDDLAFASQKFKLTVNDVLNEEVLADEN